MENAICTHSLASSKGSTTFSRSNGPDRYFTRPDNGPRLGSARAAADGTERTPDVRQGAASTSTRRHPGERRQSEGNNQRRWPRGKSTWIIRSGSDGYDEGWLPLQLPRIASRRGLQWQLIGSPINLLYRNFHFHRFEIRRVKTKKLHCRFVLVHACTVNEAKWRGVGISQENANIEEKPQVYIEANPYKAYIRSSWGKPGDGGQIPVRSARDR